MRIFKIFTTNNEMFLVEDFNAIRAVENAEKSNQFTKIRDIVDMGPSTLIEDETKSNLIMSRDECREVLSKVLKIAHENTCASCWKSIAEIEGVEKYVIDALGLGGLLT